MPRILLFALTLLTALTAAAQWTLQATPTTADLRGIDNVGHGIAWASGTDGTILRTLDNGEHWQLCAKPPNGEHLDFRAIQAFDNSTAIIMSSGKGDLSRLYKTTDGCQSWKLIFTNPDKDGFWDALQFANSPKDRVAHPLAQPKGGVSRVVARDPDHLVGFLLGDPVDDSFVLFATTDAGEHWHRLLSGPQAHAYDQGAFSASNSSLLIAENFLFFATGGQLGSFLHHVPPNTSCSPPHCASSTNKNEHKGRWDLSLVPVGPLSPSSGVFSLAARPKVTSSGHRTLIFVAVGGDYTKPNDTELIAAFSDTGAELWNPATTPPHGFRSAVAYDATTKTWITVGPNGTDISTDDGRNWRALKPDPAFSDPPEADQHWNALSLPYAVGPHGRIATLRPSALTSAK